MAPTHISETVGVLPQSPPPLSVSCPSKSSRTKWKVSVHDGCATWEATANAHCEGARVAGKKPISHITSPALCTTGDLSQSIAVVAMALPACSYTERRAPHDAGGHGWVGVGDSSSAFWSALFSCLRGGILIPLHLDFLSTNKQQLRVHP